MSAKSLLRICGVLFCLLAFSNLLKPLEYMPEQGFVFLGQRLSGTGNLILGPLFGIYLLTYGIGVLRMKKFALPMGCAYAGYVVVNLLLFNIRMPAEAQANLLFGVVYVLLAVSVSSGGAYLLYRNKSELT